MSLSRPTYWLAWLVVALALLITLSSQSIAPPNSYALTVTQSQHTEAEVVVTTSETLSPVLAQEPPGRDVLAQIVANDVHGITFKVTDRTPEVVHFDKDNEALTPVDHLPEWRALNRYSDQGRLLWSTSVHPDMRQRKARNGVIAAMHVAWAGHHNLVLRADDVALAIAMQFGQFINGHAEQLRSHFVSHEGQQPLHVIVPGGSIDSVNWNALPEPMTHEMRRHLNDERWADWFMPNFTTTTSIDRVVGGASAMIAMQEYFTYHTSLICGIPTVTLAGTAEDWLEVKRRVQKLTELEPLGLTELTEWRTLLEVVVDELVLTSQGKPNVEFWQHIVSQHQTSECGASPYISGWSTVFSYFNRFGQPTQQTFSEVFRTQRWQWNNVTFRNYDMPDVTALHGACDVTFVDNANVNHTLLLMAGFSTYAADNHTIHLNPSYSMALKPTTTWGPG